MEAQLIDTAVRPAPAPGRPQASLQTELLVRIDRYLRAAGASDSRLRSRLIADTARQLMTRGTTGSVSWAEVIAAIDRSLADEFALRAPSQPSPAVAGRIALHHLARDGVAAYGSHLPPSQRRPMPPQALLPWRPRPGWFGRLKPPPSTPALAASLCCLLVLFLP